MIERSKAKPKQNANYFRQSIGNCSMLTYVLKTASKNISFAKKLFSSPMKFALAAVTLRTAQLPVKAWQITFLLISISGEYISECRYTCMEVSNINFLEFFEVFFSRTQRFKYDQWKHHLLMLSISFTTEKLSLP